MSTIIDKIQNAIDARKSISVRVGRQTVSLYYGERTKTGNDYWTLVWYEGAQRRRKVTSHAEEAIHLAKTVLDAAGEGRLASPSLLDQPEELAGVSMNELLEFYKLHHPDFREQFNSPTTAKIAEEFIEATRKAGRSARHINTIKQQLKNFCLALPGKIGRVSVEQIDKYLHAIPAMKTRSNHRGAIVSLFRYAQRKGHLPHGTPTAAEQTDKPKIVSKEPEIYTPEEMGLLLKNASSNNLVAFLVLGGFCGLRTSEILRLRWENVRDNHIIISPDITKTARRRVAEIDANAGAWIDRVRKDAGRVSFTSDSGLYEAVEKTCKAAGVEWKPNALRHSFASYHLELYRDPPRTSKTAGHSLRVLETVYAKLVSRDEASAWFRSTCAPLTEPAAQAPFFRYGVSGG